MAIKIGVAGVGNMGRNHVRNIVELPQHFEIIGCYDTSAENLDIIRTQYGIKCFSSAEEMFKSSDAVILAIPSSLHKEYGLLAVRAGCHALIEKPLAICEADCLELCEAFNRAGKTLMVGHVERYNPVVLEIKKILEGEGGVIAVDVKRCSPFPERIYDVNVIFDLMIHDLDIVLNFLQPSPVKSIDAKGIVVKSGTNSDYVQSLITHESGAITTILASRITEEKIRSISVHTEQSLIHGDFLNKTLHVTRKSAYKSDTERRPLYRFENITERIILPIMEPLKAELVEFAMSIRENRKPLTCGESATAAVCYAGQINELTKGCKVYGK